MSVFYMTWSRKKHSLLHTRVGARVRVSRCRASAKGASGVWGWYKVGEELCKQGRSRVDIVGYVPVLGHLLFANHLATMRLGLASCEQVWRFLSEVAGR